MAILMKRVGGMLGQTRRSCQSAGGPAESARMPPRGIGTTVSAARPSRSGRGGARLGRGAGTLSRKPSGRILGDSTLTMTLWYAHLAPDQLRGDEQRL